MDEEIVQDDPELSRAQRDITDSLTVEQISTIDEKLMENACGHWRKSAYLVMAAMQDPRNNIKNVPDLFYGQRIRNLVAEGKLISQGNLNRMRYSEVKLP